MNKTILTIACIFCIHFLKGQEIISSASGSSSNQLNWTIGESFITTIVDTNFIITQGFHQSYFLLSLIEDNNLRQLSASIYPNPITKYLNINFTNVDILNKQIKLRITDNLGRIVHEEHRIQEKNIQVNTEKWVSSIYFLMLIDIKSESIKTYKLEKIN